MEIQSYPSIVLHSTAHESHPVRTNASNISHTIVENQKQHEKKKDLRPVVPSSGVLSTNHPSAPNLTRSQQHKVELVYFKPFCSLEIHYPLSHPQNADVSQNTVLIPSHETQTQPPTPLQSQPPTRSYPVVFLVTGGVHINCDIMAEKYQRMANLFANTYQCFVVLPTYRVLNTRRILLHNFTPPFFLSLCAAFFLITTTLLRRNYCFSFHPSTPSSTSFNSRPTLPPKYSIYKCLLVSVVAAFCITMLTDCLFAYGMESHGEPGSLADMIQDVADSFAWVYHHIPESPRYGNNEQIHVIAYSSGAHLTSMVLCDPSFSIRAKFDPRVLRRVVLICGIYGLTFIQYFKHVMFGWYYWMMNRGEFLPINHVHTFHTPNVPILFIQPERDMPFSLRDTQLFRNQLRKRFPNSTFLSVFIENATHASIFANIEHQQRMIDYIIPFFS